MASSFHRTFGRAAHGITTFNPAARDLRPCPETGLVTRLEMESCEPVEAAMRALVYHGPGQKAWQEVPDPEITDDGDAIVRAEQTGAVKVVLLRGSETQ
jgi:Alcohol dehydrogenase GroES-associated